MEQGRKSPSLLALYRLTKTGLDASAMEDVPDAYDGSKPFGVYLLISPGDKGENRTEYAPVMDRLNLIYISLKGTTTEQPVRRVKLAGVGGLSGDGTWPCSPTPCFPGVFVGLVSHSAQSYLPKTGTSGHFLGLTVRDLKTGPLKDHKWGVISGDQDQNYEVIKTMGEEWGSQPDELQILRCSQHGPRECEARRSRNRSQMDLPVSRSVCNGRAPPRVP